MVWIGRIEDRHRTDHCKTAICGHQNDSGLFSQTAASGAAMNEATTARLEKTKVSQGYLEGSNVQVVDEMVNLITAQRAYELNAKAITASDEMLQQANNLRR